MYSYDSMYTNTHVRMNARTHLQRRQQATHGVEVAREKEQWIRRNQTVAIGGGGAAAAISAMQTNCVCIDSISCH